jgi:hypothetical protein
MNWAIMAPYVAAGVALGVGVTSAMLSRSNARRMLEEQRALAREERLWEKHSEVYVDLLEWSAGAMTAARETKGQLEAGSAMNPDAGFLQMPTGLDARVAAYGSQEVDEAVAQLRESFRDRPAASALPTTGTARAQMRWLDDMMSAHESLRLLVRRELQLEQRDDGVRIADGRGSGDKLEARAEGGD